ncbi:D-alanyl-D-alanine dipeptidase [Pseudomonas sp. ANT_H14]|uniref:D-alanyl-D-alanine dipeptidase n=1 Tax=unclassified Pseudomonas TaxID=196821 RepID=UPI0011ED1D99|nr:MULTISPECIES: D-alanyl-D-alanine dipeptidase [unclassified Pseudomonas]KAA0942659.1 D-alanyl-D-alanine dipeptidase [Pseudomonas sp. ANT_H4]KAA0948406.1 D-alanyl-D-alanine dipeptidase [Pseudomonas sp. ANT_H14]
MNNHPLIEIDPQAYGVQIDMIYASADNLTGTVIYRNNRCLLHNEAAACLHKASRAARQAGLTLRLYDAYRPAYAQQLLWQALPNPDYVRDPHLGSHHTRGVAVDLTLIDEHGEPLDMGTAFDAMEAKSHPFYADLPPQVQRNRLLLLGIMLSAGFQSIDTEWWHYELPGAEQYPLIEEPR